MEKCTKIEEKFLNGERQLVFHYSSKNIFLNENGLINLLMQFGSLDCLKDYFNEYKLDDIKNYFTKYKIDYKISLI